METLPKELLFNIIDRCIEEPKSLRSLSNYFRNTIGVYTKLNTKKYKLKFYSILNNIYIVTNDEYFSLIDDEIFSKLSNLCPNKNEVNILFTSSCKCYSYYFYNILKLEKTILEIYKCDSCKNKIEIYCKCYDLLQIRGGYCGLRYA